MRREYYGLVLGLVWSVQCWSQASLNELEARFRSEFFQTEDNINVDSPYRQPPLQDRLMAAARQAGATHGEVQALLMKMADEGIKASAEPDALQRRRVAKSALPALGKLADAGSVDELMQMALQAPKALEISATGAVVETAYRVAPEKLETIMRHLTAGSSFSHAYAILRDAVQSYPPPNPVEYQERKILVAEIFKDGLRNGNYEDRIYLDKVIEEYDPSFHRSEERRRILTELSHSDNPIVRRYAEGKLLEYFPAVTSAEPQTDLSIANSEKTDRQAFADAEGTTNDVGYTPPEFWVAWRGLIVVGMVVGLAGVTVVLLKMRK